jgi:uncharacterized protein
MEFELDASKSSSNKAKHDIDFPAAQSLWDDTSRLEIPALNFDEPRHRVLGLIGKKVWSAIITYRHNKIRIISVRRARKNEEELYYGH